MFIVPFRGQRGGIHKTKFRMQLLAGAGNDGLVSARAAKEVQERAQKTSKRWVTRVVEWDRKLPGTNYGRGTFVGYLIYGIPFAEVMASPKRKSGWEPGNAPGNSFWFGD